jgi:hypothetical protein
MTTAATMTKALTQPHPGETQQMLAAAAVKKAVKSMIQ